MRDAQVLPAEAAEGANTPGVAAATLGRAASGDTAWRDLSLSKRLAILRRARALLADRAENFADAISPELARSRADTLVAEILPLLAAMRYLEREAERVLRTRRLGASGRPVWLGRVTSEVERVPLGRVLVIAVSNYPLFLPGVQVMQALAAGNIVIWKPGRGGRRVASLTASTLYEAGLPTAALTVTDESVTAAQEAIDSGVAKIFFTGSAAAGKEVLRRAADHVIPCVVELSGADAVIVLPGADLAVAARAIGFGLRLNGSATCMAPRRVLLVGAGTDRRSSLAAALKRELQAIGAVPVPAVQAGLAQQLLDEARQGGATVLGGELAPDGHLTPALVLNANTAMRVTHTDLFAPVLSVIEVANLEGVLAAQAACPLALTASIFGHESEARQLASHLEVGHVSINDVIVPTADPRVPFAGRKSSGFGATRGAEGLLEMTVPRAIAIRRGRSTRRYDATGEQHLGLFAGMASLLYGEGTARRIQSLSRVIEAGRALSRTEAGKKSGDA